MKYEILKKAKYLQLPWKNGKGFTSQIAIEPEGAEFSGEDFLWRISHARIDRNSAFSLFPQHDRSLVLLSGQGLVLKRPGETLDLPLLKPYAFSGADEIHCELLGEEVADFNVFTRRGECRAEVEVQEGPNIRWQPKGRWNFALAWGSDFVTDKGALGDGDTLAIYQQKPGAGPIHLKSGGTGHLVLVGIR